MRRPATECGLARRGLILVDYIVAVAVVTVMAAIMFPVFAQAREAARKTSCRTNLHQIGLALHLYARDHDGKLPPGRYMTPLLGAYVPALGAFRCPSEADGVQVGTAKLDVRAPGGLAWKGGRPVIPRGQLYCGYQYGGGLTLDSPGDARVAGDWAFRHQNRAMTLTLGGEVRPLSREEWAAYARAPALSKRLVEPPDESLTPFRPEPGGEKIPMRPAAREPARPFQMPNRGSGR